jgi:prevent-host-death family protein
MKKITVTKFKEQCLSILDRLDSKGLVVTKHGRPVARIMPIESSNADLIGKLKNKLIIKGDVFSTEVVWDAQS